MWRLAVDGVPLLGRWKRDLRCACGGACDSGAADVRERRLQGLPTPPSARAHPFWCCPVAQRVLGALAAQAGDPPTRPQLWLARAPPGLQQPVWDVVCLAALTAMEFGRQRLWSLARGQLEAETVERVGDEAVAFLWGKLAGFVALGQAPRGWGGVPLAHPFVGRSAAGCLVLNGP